MPLVEAHHTRSKVDFRLRARFIASILGIQANKLVGTVSSVSHFPGLKLVLMSDFSARSEDYKLRNSSITGQHTFQEMSDTDVEFFDSFDDDDDPDAKYDVFAVRPIDQSLEDFTNHHQHPTNVKIRYFTIPSLVVGVIGLLWAIPVPAMIIEYGSWFNVASLAMIAFLVFCARISWPLTIGMLVGGIVILLFVESLQRFYPMYLWQVSLGLVAISLIAQHIGYRMEGSKLATGQKLRFLLLAPLWLVANAYRFAQVPY